MFGIGWNKQHRKAFRRLQDPSVYRELFELYYLGYVPPSSLWNPIFCHLCQSTRATLPIMSSSIIQYNDQYVHSTVPPICNACFPSLLSLRVQCNEIRAGLKAVLASILHSRDLAKIVSDMLGLA